jgi:hypothetical protein
LKLWMSAPAPSTRFPAGQLTVRFLLAELSGALADTRSRPGGGVAQTAAAVRIQLSAVPVSSSTALTMTLVRSALGRRSSSSTWFVPPKLIQVPGLSTRLPAGQLTLMLLFVELLGLSAETGCVAAITAEALPSNAIIEAGIRRPRTRQRLIAVASLRRSPEPGQPGAAQAKNSASSSPTWSGSSSWRKWPQSGSAVTCACGRSRAARAIVSATSGRARSRSP